MTYNRQLTFNAHIKKIKRKAKSRIRCMQALSGIDWGCCRDDLRLIYLAYVRSAVEYAAPVWAPFVSKSQMNSLEVSQNAAARVITRCTKNTNVDGLLVEAGLQPLQLRCEELAVAAYEKALRLPESNPRRGIAETEVRQRLKRDNWRDAAVKTAAGIGLNDVVREGLVTTVHAPPWQTTSTAVFNEFLLEPVSRHESSDRRKEVAQRTIESLDGAALDIYTDGSASEGHSLGGGGVLIIDKIRDNESELMEAAGKWTNSYRTKLVAIEKALREVARM